MSLQSNQIGEAQVFVGHVWSAYLEGRCSQQPPTSSSATTSPLSGGGADSEADSSVWSIMKRDSSSNGTADGNNQHEHGEPRASVASGSASISATHSATDAPKGSADNTAGASPTGSERTESFNNNIALFLDRTFRMIESVPDDIVCWSEAGDSFIIKQVGAAASSARRRAAEESFVFRYAASDASNPSGRRFFPFEEGSM